MRSKFAHICQTYMIGNMKCKLSKKQRAKYSNNKEQNSNK